MILLKRNQEIKKIPPMVTAKICMHLLINVTQEVKNLYNKNYKIL